MLHATIDLLGQSADRRVGTRVRVDRSSTLRDAGGAPRDVLVGDLSQAGFRYVSPKPLPIGTVVRLGLAGAGTAEAIVVRQDGDEYGCEFITSLTPAQVEAAFARAIIVHATTIPVASHDTAPDGRWPAVVRLALVVGCGAAAWVAVATLIGALG